MHIDKTLLGANHVDFNIYDENNEPLRLELYVEDLNKMRGATVSLTGLVSAKRQGRIVGLDLFYPNLMGWPCMGLFAVVLADGEDASNNKNFASNGDSGALVCGKHPNSGKMMAIGIVIGGGSEHEVEVKGEKFQHITYCVPLQNVTEFWNDQGFDLELYHPKIKYEHSDSGYLSSLPSFNGTSELDLQCGSQAENPEVAFPQVGGTTSVEERDITNDEPTAANANLPSTAEEQTARIDPTEQTADTIVSSTDTKTSTEESIRPIKEKSAETAGTSVSNTQVGPTADLSFHLSDNEFDIDIDPKLDRDMQVQRIRTDRCNSTESFDLSSFAGSDVGIQSLKTSHEDLTDQLSEDEGILWDRLLHTHHERTTSPTPSTDKQQNTAMHANTSPTQRLKSVGFGQHIDRVAETDNIDDSIPGKHILDPWTSMERDNIWAAHDNDTTPKPRKNELRTQSPPN